MKNNIKDKRIAVNSVYATCLFGVIYSLVYIYFKYSNLYIISGYLSFFGECCLDFSIMTASFFAWKKSTLSLRIFFLFIFIAYLSAFIADGVYNYLINIMQIKINTFYDSLFDIPFLIFLFFQMLSLFLLFSKYNCKLGNLYNYIPYIFASFIIFLSFVYFIHWNVLTTSIIGIYQIADTFLESIGFLFACFCLIRTNVSWVKYFGIGYLIVISSDFLIRYGVVDKKYFIVSQFEITWIFGLTFILFSILKYNVQNESKEIFQNFNSLKSKISIWIFTFLLFIVSIIESLYSTILQNKLSFLLIILFIFSVIFSEIFAFYISKPLLNIKKIIELFNINDIEFKNIKVNSDIEELKSIELFLIESLKVKSEKMALENNFNKIARQVAHDLRQSLTVLEICSNSINDGEKKQLVANSLNNLREISNNLLICYKKQKNKYIEKIECVSPLTIIENVIYEMKLINPNTPSFIYNILEDYNAYIWVNLIDFKRVIFNLIDNAIDAVNKSYGLITITIKPYSYFTRIEISDNGFGIPTKILPCVFDEGFTYGKVKGSGIGLNFVINCLKKWNCNYDLKSIEGVGTTFIMDFPNLASNKSNIIHHHPH